MHFLRSVALLICVFYLLKIVHIIVARVLGYTVRIGNLGVRQLALSDLSLDYARRDHTKVSISLSRIQFSLHIPRPSYPVWAKLTASDYQYVDAECRTSLAELEVTLWFFPVLFRFTSGPVASVELRDFKVRVFSSRITPFWVQGLRRNLISTILIGETVRLDKFQTKVQFSTLTGTESSSGDGEVEKPGLNEKEEQDEARVSASSEQWHIRNWLGRIYTFGKLDAQLRRSWVEDRGSFVLIAEESRWTKVPSFNQDVNYRTAHWLWQLIESVIVIPSGIMRVMYDPLSMIDLYVTRSDITFDSFRIRDAELLAQGGMMLKRQYDTSRSSGVLQGIGWDNFVQTVIFLCG